MYNCTSGCVVTETKTATAKFYHVRGQRQLAIGCVVKAAFLANCCYVLCVEIDGIDNIAMYCCQVLVLGEKLALVGRSLLL